MTRTIKKSLVLAVAVSAMAAMAVPSMASAAVWGPAGPPGYDQNLTPTGGLGLSVNDFGTPYGLGCTGGGFAVHARFPYVSTLDVLTAAGYTCFGTGGWQGCNATLTPTGLPWTASGASTTNVTLNTVNYNVVFSDCRWAGPTFVLQGALAGGVWSAVPRSVSYSNDSGLNLTGPGGYNRPVTATTTLADPISNGYLTLS